jgi:hypothetical protein
MLKMVKIPTAKNQMAAAIEAEYLRRRKKPLMMNGLIFY